MQVGDRNDRACRWIGWLLDQPHLTYLFSPDYRDLDVKSQVSRTV